MTCSDPLSHPCVCCCAPAQQHTQCPLILFDWLQAVCTSFHMFLLDCVPSSPPSPSPFSFTCSPPLLSPSSHHLPSLPFTSSHLYSTSPSPSLLPSTTSTLCPPPLTLLPSLIPIHCSMDSSSACEWIVSCLDGTSLDSMLHKVLAMCMTAFSCNYCIGQMKFASQF